MTPAPTDNAVNWAQVRLLFRLFFRLNFRGHLSQSFKKGKKDMGLFGILFWYAFFGLFLGFMAFSGMDLLTYGLILNSMTFFLAAMAAILESDQILFNPKEEEILGHRPISSRTLVVAKALNLACVTTMLTGSFSLIPTLCLNWIKGMPLWITPAHLFTLILLNLFCASGVVFVFGLVARLVGREKFQSLATWTQVFMILLFTVGSQLFPRMMVHLRGFSLGQYLPYLVAYPPAWFASLDATLAGAQPSGLELLLAATAVLATLGLAWGAVVRMASMQGRISASTMETPGRVAPEASVRPGRPTRLNPFLRWWLRDPVERGAFRLVASYLRRDRFTMRQIYPLMGYVVIFPLIFIFSGRHPNHGDDFSMNFVVLWLLMFLPASALEALRISEDPAAAELFAYVPLAGAGGLFHGARKAVLYYLTLPAVLAFMGIQYFAAHGQFAGLAGLLPTLLLVPAISLLPGLSGSYLPLSKPPQSAQRSGRVIKMFLLMIPMAVTLSLSGYAVRSGKLPLLLAIEVPLAALFYWALTRRVNRPRPIRLD